MNLNSISPSSTSIKILNKTYQVSCPEGKLIDLENAAQYLNQKMNEIRLKGKVTAIDRIAIMSALNITDELLTHLKQKEADTRFLKDQIESLQKKIDKALIEDTVEG